MIADAFRTVFGREPEVMASAPGRVNLIGEHVDYNEGFVLPMAIDRRTSVAMARRDDTKILAASAQFPGTQEARHTPRRGAGDPNWSDYVGAVAWALQGDGESAPGFDVYVESDVPTGAGLSSSAALELALARGISAMTGTAWVERDMALAGQRAENEFVGVRCGIMDQMASSMSRAGAAMLLDCRSLDASFTAIPHALAIIVMDTGVRRALSASEFNERRSACEQAVLTIQARHHDVRALRDVTPGMLDECAPLLDAHTLRRVQHVVSEMSRPAAMVRALEANDLRAAGALLNDSHASLAKLYEVSSTHLDIICEEARAHPACYGARLTGAGFGGCAIAFVDADRPNEFIAAVQPRYEARTYKKSAFFRASPAAGARLERAQ